MVLISRTVQEKSGRGTDIYPNESSEKNQTSDTDEDKGQGECFKLSSCRNTRQCKNMVQRNNIIQKQALSPAWSPNPKAARPIILLCGHLLGPRDSHMLGQFSVAVSLTVPHDGGRHQLPSSPVVKELHILAHAPL